MCEWITILMILFGCDLTDVDKNGYLYLGNSSNDKTALYLINNRPVRGIQFHVSDCHINYLELSMRAKGFSVKYDPVNGIVVFVSLSGDTIRPYLGAIAVMSFEQPCNNAYLTDIKISYAGD